MNAAQPMSLVMDYARARSDWTVGQLVLVMELRARYRRKDVMSRADNSTHSTFSVLPLDFLISVSENVKVANKR